LGTTFWLVGSMHWVNLFNWSFPGCRRIGLATLVSSNCFFRCLKVGSNFRTLSHVNSKTQLCSALSRHSHTHSTSIAITRLH